jgi:hypothetical protein
MQFHRLPVHPRNSAIGFFMAHLRSNPLHSNFASDSLFIVLLLNVIVRAAQHSPARPSEIKTWKQITGKISPG